MVPGAHYLSLSDSGSSAAWERKGGKRKFLAITLIAKLGYVLSFSNIGLTAATLSTVLVAVNANGEGPALAEVAEFPVATTSEQEASGRAAAFDGTNYLVPVLGDSIGTGGDPDSRKIGAQMVSQSGALVGSLIVTGRFGYAPTVAFDGTNYLLVWDDASNRIEGQFISTAGAFVGTPFTISTSTLQTEGPSISFDGTNCFVVWSTFENLANGSGQNFVYRQLRGQLVSKAGDLVGSEITLSSGIGLDSSVAFDGTNYLVVWLEATAKTDIYGQLVSLAGGLVGSNFVIDENALESGFELKVIFDGTNYFVTFGDEVATNNIDLFARFVGKDGDVATNRVTISTAAGNQVAASPTFNGTNYLVTWTDGFGTAEASFKGMLFDASGGPVALEFTLSSPGSDDRVPILGFTQFNASKYFIVLNRGTSGADPFDIDAYTSQDIFGAFFDASEVAASRPDVAVGASAVDLRGAGIYPPSSQIVTLKSKKLKPVTGYASIANRGNRPDVLSVSGRQGTAFFKVIWTGPSGNVTAAMNAGTYRTQEMVSSDPAVALRGTITPNKKKLTKTNKKPKRTTIVKKTLLLSLRASSTFDPAISDAATIQVKTK